MLYQLWLVSLLTWLRDKTQHSGSPEERAAQPEGQSLLDLTNGGAPLAGPGVMDSNLAVGQPSALALEVQYLNRKEVFDAVAYPE